MIGVTTRTDTAGVYSSTGDEGLPQILVNGGDAIGIQGTSKNIWIDHCELFAENPDTQTNKDLYDGLIDVKGQTGFITISWNYLHDQHKGGLVGSSDTDLFADRKITYHHNYYNKVKLRVPMYRGAVGHFFNNYIVGATDASEIRAGTCVRIEKNYYEALHYSIYTPSDSPGSTERIDNVEVSAPPGRISPNRTAAIPHVYSDVLTANTTMKTTVPPAGVGKFSSARAGCVRVCACRETSSIGARARFRVGERRGFTIVSKGAHRQLRGRRAELRRAPAQLCRSSYVLIAVAHDAARAGRRPRGRQRSALLNRGAGGVTSTSSSTAMRLLNEALDQARRPIRAQTLGSSGRVQAPTRAVKYPQGAADPAGGAAQPRQPTPTSRRRSTRQSPADNTGGEDLPSE
jgi:hypothetical protein